MTRRHARRLILPALLLATAAVAVPGGDAIYEALWQRPSDADDTVIVPDRFLRSWDPITIFFDGNRVKGPGPEDDPSKHAALDPPWPGAWQWLDRRTLQFRPAEPWPALRRFTVKADGETRRVATLMTPPSRTAPRDGADGLEPVEDITLTFPTPVPTAALAEMLTIELRALPGLGDGPVQRLGAEDFAIKALQRARADAPARYTVTLARPIPAGIRATLRFALALDDGAEAVTTVDFSTAEPFRVKAIACRGGSLPVGPDGARYSKDQPLRCRGDRRLYLDFTAEIADWTAIEGRSLVRFEPAVKNVEFRPAGRRLQISGDFERETLYRVSVVPAPVRDRRDRALELREEASAWMYFPRQSPYLRWTKSEGIAELRGPQRVPLQGRGHGRADLRVHRVDPLDRNFWPFPSRVPSLDESQRPPGPGEVPDPWTAPDPIPSGELNARLRAMGTPGVSTLVDLPLRPEGDAATFGLDLRPHLARIAGKSEPGHYLVGLRLLDGSTRRSWMRLQVTDLTLSTVESADDVRFVVTSLDSGKPVRGAKVRVEGRVSEAGKTTWQRLFDGTTDGKGMVRWQAPGRIQGRSVTVRRITVTRGDDILVLDPADPPETFRDDHWRHGGSDWLGWTSGQLDSRKEKPDRLCHVFTERPMYRPEHPVHIKGWVRTRFQGDLTVNAGIEGTIRIEGPDGDARLLPVTTTATGGFYARWEEDDPPTGTYEAVYADKDNETRCRAAFEVEAYRLPRFEVDLIGDRTVPLDAPFATRLVASWYAGGQVVERPVSWRVTQFPYAWTPEPRAGFVYSSDGRYTRTRRFTTRPAVTQDGITDAQGAATIELDPSVEPTAQPRTYVIEATVTGDDDQTVTSVKRVNAVPAFALGLKLPRYLPTAEVIRPEIIVAGPDGGLKAGVEVQVTLKRRAWHAHLQASDFAHGEARYVTDIVDEPVLTTKVTSAEQPITTDLAIEKAGVYLVELEARDRLGRAQVVTLDLYAGGTGAVAWDKPEAGVFELSSDREKHRPGQTARVVLQSPFQRAEALVIIETPTGNRYRWLPVREGKASLGIELEDRFAPRLPVHVVLMRGRVGEGTPGKATARDLGKPTTVASTLWLEVEPRGNRVDVKLSHPDNAMPGQTFPLTVELKDPDGKPQSGEVTLWLVDKAVLALAEEARLDPLPDFITDPRSRVEVRDTRNLGFGRIPFAEMPGGGDGDDEEDALDRITVRKNFQPVPYYEAALAVDDSGERTVQVTLPDNLTVFAIRAKAAAGPRRFGFAKSAIEVRLPLLVQPALPRFVRPGDAFTAAAVGRIVEGAGGPGEAKLEATGLTVGGDARQVVAWDPLRARRLRWPVTVDMPPLGADGEPETDRATVKVAASRQADGAGDAFQVELPVQPDRRPVFRRRILELKAGQPAALEALDEPARPGTLRRTVMLASRPALARMAAALDAVRRPTTGDTRQRLARARAVLGVEALRDALLIGDPGAMLDRLVAETLAWLPLVIDDRGLVGWWPGTRGRVDLTADAAHFLADAIEAGYTVDRGLQTRLTDALRRALRSDAGWFVSGERWYERSRALDGLAHLEALDPPYFAEMARNAQFLGYDGLSSAVLAGSRAPDVVDDALYTRLVEAIAGGITVRLYQGREIYSGLRRRLDTRHPLILASEARSLAEMTRALVAAGHTGERLDLVADALVQLGRGDGWGSPSTDAAALLALADWLGKAGGQTARAALAVDGGDPITLKAGDGTPVASHITEAVGSGTLTLAPDGPKTAVALEMVRYVPAAPPRDAPAQSDGFVVTREWQQIQADAPPVRTPIEGPGQTLAVAVGAVIEEHIQVVNPEDRYYVAVTAPLAAGLEPLNPRLATAPPEAAPTGQLSATPDYVQYLDDRVVWHYESLPKGTYDFYYRVRATVDGGFGQPPARAEQAYDRTVRGRSPGAGVKVEPGR